MHLKILKMPVSPSLARQLASMREVYASAGIRVLVASTEVLNLPHLLDVDVGNCVDPFPGDDITGDIAELARHRNFAGEREMVIYFVRQTMKAFAGCAHHPPNRPGAIVTESADVWTLAHEVGHVLGLHHVSEITRLMYEDGTHNITNPPLI